MPEITTSAFPTRSASTDTHRSLPMARSAVPPGCYQRSTARGLAYVVRDAVLYAGSVTALVLNRNPLVDAVLVVVAGLAISALFVQAHDAAHGALFGSRRLNAIIARSLMLPSLHLYEAWVFGHNRIHHGHTARQGMDFVWHPITPAGYLALSRLARFRHRLEWSWAGAGAYYLREVWWNRMVSFSPPPKLARAWRADRRLVIVWALAASAVALWAGWWRSGSALGAAWVWAEIIVLPFLVFVQVIGWAVYVHHVDPAIRWWGRREWTPSRGQLESTTVLRLPRVFNVFFHDIFVHVPHHVDTRIPWYHLREAAASLEAAFPGMVKDQRFRVSSYLAATRACKLYDFDRGAWLTYGAVDIGPSRAKPSGPRAGGR